MKKLMFAAAACALLAGCEAQQPANRAEAPGNETASANETRTAGLGDPVDAARAKALMHERHEGMEDIGDAMKILSRELKGDTPDLAAVRTNAATIAELAPKASGWFPPGTGPDVGKTHAKPAIWEKPEDFAAKSDAFAKAAASFNTVAQGNDVAAIKAAHGELGKSCKACHDLYRAKDD